MLEVIQMQPFFKEDSDMLLFPFNQTLFSFKLLFSFLPPTAGFCWGWGRCRFWYRFLLSWVLLLLLKVNLSFQKITVAMYSISHKPVKWLA